MFVPLFTVPINCSPQRLAPIWAAVHRLARCSSGIVSVEFVIFLPLLVLFLFGIIGFSMTSYTHTNMVSAAREATRHLAVADGVGCTLGGTTGPCTGASLVCGVSTIAAGSAEDIACTNLPDLALLWTVTANEVVTDACDSTMQVRISTSAEDAFMFDFMDFFGAASLLTAEVKMRKELEEVCSL